MSVTPTTPQINNGALVPPQTGPSTTPATPTNTPQTGNTGQPATDLYSWFASQGQQLPHDVGGRFANPTFAEAARQLGYTPQTYQINANNAGVNQAILARIQQIQGGGGGTGGTGTPTGTGGTGTPTNTGAVGTPSLNAPPAPQSTGNPQLDNFISQENNSSQGLLKAWSDTNASIESLMQGNIPYTPQQQQMLNLLRSGGQRAIQSAQEATAAETAMIRYNLAKSGATQTSPAVAASELALATQAGANAVLDVSDKATMALANYEQQIQAGDVQAARDSFKSYQDLVNSIDTHLKDTYSAVATYQQDMRTYDLAVKNYQLEQQKLGIEFDRLGIEQGNLNLATEVAGTTTTTTKPSLFQAIWNDLRGIPNPQVVTKTPGGGGGSTDNPLGLDL